MLRLVPCTAMMVLVALSATADVLYVEEVVHSGVGNSKRGARKTTVEVAIKGASQRVSADIEASKDVVRTLQKQGVALRETKILRLDQGQLIDIDRSTQTYRNAPLPAPRPAPAAGGTAKPAGRTPATDPNREINVRAKTFDDTTRVAGILCRRVAAEMTARHFQPGTRTVVRTNRYLYQAWMAEDFPGYADIVAFRQRQEARTSMAPLVRGGLDQLGDSIDDSERLADELASLTGFPMQSKLQVYTKVGNGKERELMTLTRRVLRLTHQPLPDTLFRPSRELKLTK